MRDFDALAAALGAEIAETRGCLILSRDGLVLGGHPAAAEADVKAAWIRFAALGEPERGFVQFGTEIWSYVARGPYAAFAVTGPGVRPGLVIDQMERALLAAQQDRSGGEGSTGASPSPAAPTPSKKRKPPTPHRDARSGAEPVAARAPSPEAAAEPPAEPSPAAPAASEAPQAPPRAPRSGPSPGPDEDGEIDRFSLAREFSQLLQDEPDDADG